MQVQNYLNGLKEVLNRILNLKPAENTVSQIPENDDISFLTESSDETGTKELDITTILSNINYMDIPLPGIAPEGYVFVNDGDLKSIAHLKEYEIKREAILQNIAQRAIELYIELTKLKKEWNAAFDSIEEMNTPKNSKRVKAAKKPSLTLFLLDRSVALDRRRSDCVRYEEDTMLRAKTLVDDCVSVWSENSVSEIQQITTIAFSKNEKGNYSRTALLRLRKIVTANLKWKEAMDLIKQAEIVDGMSSYLSISIRDRLGKYIPLPLDLTKVREYKE